MTEANERPTNEFIAAEMMKIYEYWEAMSIGWQEEQGRLLSGEEAGALLTHMAHSQRNVALAILHMMDRLKWAGIE